MSPNADSMASFGPRKSSLKIDQNCSGVQEAKIISKGSIACLQGLLPRQSMVYLLNKYLGKYVQDLDAEKINLGILNGEVELLDLQIKPEALYELDLPIEVKIGCIGRILIKIPWRNLSVQPVVINIEDVLVLVGPIKDRKYDADLEKRLLRAVKNRKLQQIEDSEHLISDDNSDEFNSAFWEKTSATIMNNIQLYVSNVHICYEDIITNSGCPLSCGLVLHNLTAETTNNKWKSSQIDSSATSVFKLIKLESLSFYWNSLCNNKTLTRNYLLMSNWKTVMKKGLETFSMNGEDYDFILKPVSAKVKVIMNKSNEAKVPKLLLDFVLQDVAAQVSRQQYLSILSLWESFERMNVSRRFFQYHPGVPVTGNVKAWWRYASKSVLEELVRSYSWPRIQKHRESYKKCRDLYKQRLYKPLDSELRVDLFKQEDSLDLTSIVLAREEARIQFSKEEPQRATRKKVQRPWWKIWPSNKEAEVEEWNIPNEKDNGLLTRLTSDEKQQLLDAIGQSENKPISDMPKQYIEHKLNFTFANCTLSLLNYSQEVLVLTLTQFLTSIDTRPTAEAFRISARAESFLIEGAAVEHDLVPIVSADNISGGTTSPYVLSFDFEKNPLHMNADFGITLQTEPVEVVYQEHAFSEIAAFFHCHTWKGLDIKDLVVKRLEELRKLGKSAVEYMLKGAKKSHITVDVKSPYLIIPEHGTIQKGGNVLVLDFGRLTITTDLQPDNVLLEDATRTELEERLYDRFHVTLSDVQVLFADSGDEWRAGRSISESDTHLVPKLRMQFTMANSIRPDYQQLPRQKLNFNLPSVKLNLSDRRLRQLFEFMQNLPRPTTRRVYAQASDLANGKSQVDQMDMSQVIWEPDTRHLRAVHQRLLFIVAERERQPTMDSLKLSPSGPLTRQPSDVHSIHDDHSDEEMEQWARTVDLPGFDDNVSPSNAINVLLRLIIGEIVLQLARSSDHVDKPYLMLRIEKLCADVALMEYGPALQASLGQIQLVDKLHMGSTGEYLELINSIPGASDTISILYRKVRSDCPDFRSHFHNVEQSFVLTVSTIRTTFHRGAFMTLHKFLQYVIERLCIKNLKLRKISLNANPTQFLPMDIRDPPVPPGATKCSISARIDEIKIKCCDSDMDLTDIKIAGFETDFVLKANEKMVVRVYLSYLSVHDLSDMTLYTKILSIEDDKVFDLKYVRHSSRPTKQDLVEESQSVKCDSSIWLRIGRIQFCLLYKFLSDLKRFLEPFHHPELTNTAAKAAEKAIQEQIVHFRNRGTTVNLSVDIHAPTIIIPQKSDSPNLLVLRLGDLSVENFFKEVKIYNGSSTGHLVDNLLIRLNHVQMNRAIITIDGSMEEMENILEPVRVRLDMKRAVPPFHRDLLLYDFNGTIDSLKINIGQRDLGLLLGIYKENAFEGQFTERSPGGQITCSPMDTPSPISGTEDAVGKKLQAFFNTSIDVYKEANFQFILEGAQLTFYYDSDEMLSSTSRNESHGLSRFEMDEVSLSLEVYSDKSLEMKCALQALSLEDIRQESRLAVRKIFQSYSGDNKLDMGMISVSMPPMIDVSYKQSQTGDIAVDILMEKTRLNVSVPYVLSLVKFLYEAWPTEKPADGGIINPGFSGEMSTQGKIIIEGNPGKHHHRHTSSSDSTSGYHSSTSTLPDEIPSLTITTKLKKPEVVLFADPTDKNSHVLVLKADVFFDYNRMVSQKSLSASVAGLQLLSCVYGKRRQTAYLVLQPCDIEVTKTTTNADETTIVRTCMSTVDLRLSTSTVHTIRDVADELANSLKFNPDIGPPSAECENKELQELWAIKKIFPQKWTESSEDEGEQCPRALYTNSKSKEHFMLCVPSIQLVCELEEKKCHLPLVLLRMGLEADAHEWSKQLYLKGEMRLELSYFNEKLSTWEPLVEPVLQAENSYRPWEILIKIFRQTSRPISCNIQDDVLFSMENFSGHFPSIRSQTISESSSSGEDSESDEDMKIIRKPSVPRLKKIHAQKSYDSGSLIGYTMDSDSENEEGVLDKLATAFGHMFSSESSEAEESESEKEDQTLAKSEEDIEDAETESGCEEDETDPTALSPGCEKPIFLTKQGTEGGESVDSGVDDGSSTLVTHVIIDSRDKLDITVSPMALKVITEVVKAFTSTSLTHQSKNHWSSTSSLEVFNKIGPQSKVLVIEKSERGNDDEDRVLAMSGYDETELPSSPASTGILVDISPTESEGDVEGDEVDRFSISSALAHTENTLVNNTAMEYEEMDVTTVYKEVMKERVNIEVEGFEKLQCYMPRRAETRVFALHPQRNDTRYHVVVNVDTHHGYKAVTVSSPLQVQNCLSQPINLYYKKKALESLGVPPPSHPKNPFEEKLWLAILHPGETYSVPLFLAYHCSLYAQPACLPYNVSERGIWWQELSSGQNQSKLIMCSPKDTQRDAIGFAIKVVCEDGVKLKTAAISGRLIPNYILSLYPPICIHNTLPYQIEINAAENFDQEIKLDPGEKKAISNIDLSKSQSVKIEVPNYLGLQWTGQMDVCNDMEDNRTINMAAEFNSCDIENKQLIINLHVERKKSLNVYIYSPYWIVNKTGLPLQIRGSGSSVVYESSLTDEPLLFRFKRHRRKKAKIRIYNSRWSAALSVDIIGSSGVIICKDKEREKKYQFLLNIQLSELKLTKMVVIKPYFLVINNTKRHLRFMEQNEKADFWVDIGPAQSIPFWPDTESMQMHVKFRDSKIVSQPFFIHKTHDTVLRMDQGSALCVSVHGGMESPMTITLFPYIPGNAPVRVENCCEDLFLKIHQKSMGQVALLSPYQSVLYTWDDPTKERTLMWNIYNRNKPGFPAFIGKDGHGQEKVSFHTLRPTTSNSAKNCVPSSHQSSTDDDSDLTDDVDLNMSKKTRKDKVVVYWVSYLDGHERVLMFTQDERVAKLAKKKIDGSKANFECCISLGGVGISLINEAFQEVTYMTLSHAPSVWEVEINHKWKILPLELSAWLEDKWKTDQNKAEMKDYVQVDFSKMQMTKPFFGRLYRRFYPAVWCQYRSSQYLSYLHFKLHRLQMDNQLPEALFPTVLYPAPMPPFVVRKTGIRPFVEFSLVQRHNPKKSIRVIKYLKILIQEFNVRLDKGFVLSVLDLFASLPEIHPCGTTTIKSDLEIIRAPLIPSPDCVDPQTSNFYMFEYVHLSPVKINFSFSPRGTIAGSSSCSNGQHDLLEFLTSTVGATLCEVKEVQLRLPYFQSKGMVSPLPRMIWDVKCHYLSQFVQQFYVFVLGVDVLGNPYAIIQDFTEGLGDYYYEPFMGIIKTPDEYADSIAIRMQALLGHIVGEAIGSTALVTGTLGQAIAALSLDEDYKRKRRQRCQQNTGFPDTLAASARTFSMGVSMGLSGVHVKPVVGIHQEGIEGFFKGMGKGLMGLLTKPAGGIVDMVGMAYDGVRRAAEMGEHVVMRMRLARYLNPQQGSKPYSPYQAAGYRLLLKLSKGHYAESDTYWAHATMKKEDRTTVVLVTDRHVFELVRFRLWGEFDVLWKVNLDDIIGVPTISSNKIILNVRQDESLNLFPGEECFVSCDDPTVLHWLQRKIEKVLIAHMEERPCANCS